MKQTLRNERWKAPDFADLLRAAWIASIAGSAFLCNVEATAAADFSDLDGLATNDPTREESSSEWEVSAAGSLEFLSRFYPFDRENRYSNQPTQLLISTELEARSGRFSVLFNPWLVGDWFDEDNLRVMARDAYLQWDSTQWDFRVGQFVESWAMVDTFSPLDGLNRKDSVISPNEPVSLGELGTRWRFHLGGSRQIQEQVLSIYWIPVFQSTPQPGPRNRFSIAAMLPGSRLMPEQKMGFVDGQFAAVTYSHTLNVDSIHADLLYVASRGPGRSPTYVTDPLGVVVTPTYYGLWTLGLGVRAVPSVSPLNHTTVKAELVLSEPYRIQGPPDSLPKAYFQAAVGVEQDLGSLVSSASNLTIFAEYLADVGSDDLAAQLRIFDHDLVVGAVLPFGDLGATSVSLSALIDVRGENIRMQAQVGTGLRFLSDATRLELSATYLNFGADTVYRNLPQNSDFTITLIQNF